MKVELKCQFPISLHWMWRRARSSVSPFPICSKSSRPQLPGFSFLSCAELQRIQSMKARPNPQNMVNVMHTKQCFHTHDLLVTCIYLLVTMFLWSRFGGSGSHFGALDLSYAGSAVYTLCLPQPLLQSPEEHQALCQHGSEKHIYQWPAARSRLDLLVNLISLHI